MGSTTNGVGQMLTYMTQSAAAVSVSSVTELKQNGIDASASFSNILNKTSEKIIKTTEVKTSQNQSDKKVDVKVKQDADSPNKDLSKVDDNSANIHKTDDSVKDNDLSQNQNSVATENIKNTDVKETTDGKEANNELQEALEEAGKELVSEIAKALDLDEEDVLNAMQVLGLMLGDLLNPENIQLVVETAGGPDKALDLITDSDLYASMQDLIEGADSMRSELLNEFDLSEEDLQAEIWKMEKDFSFVPDETVKVINEKPVQKEPEIIVNEAGDNLSKEIKGTQSKETLPEIKVEEQSEEVESTTFKPVEESFETSKEGNKETKSDLNESGQNPNLFNQLLNNITDAVDVNSMSSVSYTDRAQMENIIRQITEKITISSGIEETSMELKLHPAHLGNVNILLTSSKDGIIAKFTAQNEIVKEAVESQMLQLQQKFEQQGIKVTSIEVTIASHAFEQNLQQDDKNSGFEEQKAKSKKSLRRINLADGIPADEEEISEDDILAAKVMEMNGNTVDYSA